MRDRKRDTTSLVWALFFTLTLFSQVASRINNPVLYNHSNHKAICLSSCKGNANGKYQFCGSCEYFVHCVNGSMNLKSCPEGLTWDDTRKRCVYPHRSRTCPWILP